MSQLAQLNQSEIDTLSRKKAQEIALKYGIPASWKTERILEKIRELKLKHEQSSSDTSVFEEDLQFLQTLSNNNTTTDNASTQSTQQQRNEVSLSMSQSQSHVPSIPLHDSTLSLHNSTISLHASISELSLNNAAFLSSSNSSACLAQPHNVNVNPVFGGGSSMTTNNPMATNTTQSLSSPHPAMMTNSTASTATSTNNPMGTNNTASGMGTNNTSGAYGTNIRESQAGTSTNYARAHGQATSLVLPTALRTNNKMQTQNSTSSLTQSSSNNPTLTNTTASHSSHAGSGSFEPKHEAPSKKNSFMERVSGVSKESTGPSVVKYYIYHLKGKGVVTTDKNQAFGKTIRSVLETLKLITPISKITVPPNMFVAFLPDGGKKTLPLSHANTNIETLIAQLITKRVLPEGQYRAKDRSDNELRAHVTLAEVPHQCVYLHVYSDPRYDLILRDTKGKMISLGLPLVEAMGSINKFSYTPSDAEMVSELTNAIWDGEMEHSKILLQNPHMKRLINVPNDRGQTALFCAARQGHADLVLALFAVPGLDINAQSVDHGSTPLHAASYNCFENIVAILIYRGANINVKNKMGLTAKAEARGAAIEVYQNFQQLTKQQLEQKYPLIKNVTAADARGSTYWGVGEFTPIYNTCVDGGVTSSDQAFNANVKKSKKEKVNVVSRIQGQYNSNRQHLNAANLWTYYLHFAPKVDIMDIGPLELAQQISLLDQELMNRIQPNELKTAGFNKEQKRNISPNVLESISFFNWLNNWIITEIITRIDLSQRIEVLCFMIELLQYLLMLNNLNSFFTVTLALQMSLINRLKEAFQGVPDNFIQFRDKAQALCSPLNNFANLREYTMNISPPGVPYLGIFLKDLVIVNEAKLPDNIKEAKAQHIVDLLGKWQATPYRQMKKHIGIQRILQSSWVISEPLAEDLSKFIEQKTPKSMSPDDKSQFMNRNRMISRLILDKARKDEQGYEPIANEKMSIAAFLAILDTTERDFAITCADGVLRMHSLILEVRCPALFSKYMDREKWEPLFAQLSKARAAMFEAYIYKDEIDWVEDITPHEMFCLWEISKRLEIYRLEGLIFFFAQRTQNIGNCFDYSIAAIMFKNKELWKQTMLFLQEHTYGLDQYSSHPHYELFTQEVDLFAIFTLESLSRGDSRMSVMRSKQEKDRNKIPDSMFSFDIYSLVQRTKQCDVELVVDDAFGNGSAKYHAHHVILATQSTILQLKIEKNHLEAIMSKTFSSNMAPPTQPTLEEEIEMELNSTSASTAKVYNINSVVPYSTFEKILNFCYTRRFSSLTVLDKVFIIGCSEHFALHNFRAINEFLKIDLLTLSLQELKEIESAVAGLYNIESAKILAQTLEAQFKDVPQISDTIVKYFKDRVQNLTFLHESYDFLIAENKKMKTSIEKLEEKQSKADKRILELENLLRANNIAFQKRPETETVPLASTPVMTPIAIPPNAASPTPSITTTPPSSAATGNADSHSPSSSPPMPAVIPRKHSLSEVTMTNKTLPLNQPRPVSGVPNSILPKIPLNPRIASRATISAGSGNPNPNATNTASKDTNAPTGTQTTGTRLEELQREGLGTLERADSFSDRNSKLKHRFDSNLRPISAIFLKIAVLPVSDPTLQASTSSGSISEAFPQESPDSASSHKHQFETVNAWMGITTNPADSAANLDPQTLPGATERPPVTNPSLVKISSLPKIAPHANALSSTGPVSPRHSPRNPNFLAQYSDSQRLADEKSQQQSSSIGTTSTPHSLNSPRAEHHQPRTPLPRAPTRPRQLSVAYQIPGIERLSGRVMLTGALMMSPKASGEVRLGEDASASHLDEHEALDEAASVIGDPNSPLVPSYGPAADSEDGLPDEELEPVEQVPLAVRTEAEEQEIVQRETLDLEVVYAQDQLESEIESTQQRIRSISSSMNLEAAARATSAASGVTNAPKLSGSWKEKESQQQTHNASTQQPQSTQPPHHLLRSSVKHFDPNSTPNSGSPASSEAEEKLTRESEKLQMLKNQLEEVKRKRNELNTNSRVTSRPLSGKSHGNVITSNAQPAPLNLGALSLNVNVALGPVTEAQPSAVSNAGSLTSSSPPSSSAQLLPPNATPLQPSTTQSPQAGSTPQSPPTSHQQSPHVPQQHSQPPPIQPAPNTNPAQSHYQPPSIANQLPPLQLQQQSSPPLSHQQSPLSPKMSNSPMKLQPTSTNNKTNLTPQNMQSTPPQNSGTSSPSTPSISVNQPSLSMSGGYGSPSNPAQQPPSSNQTQVRPNVLVRPSIETLLQNQQNSNQNSPQQSQSGQPGLATNQQPLTPQQTNELQRYQKPGNPLMMQSPNSSTGPQQQGTQQPTKMQPGGVVQNQQQQQSGVGAQSLQPPQHVSYPSASPRANITSPRPPSVTANSTQSLPPYGTNNPNTLQSNPNPNLSNSGNANANKQQYQPPTGYQGLSTNQRVSTSGSSLTDSPRMISPPPLTSSQLTSPRITQVQRQPNHHYQHMLKDLNTQLEEGDIL